MNNTNNITNSETPKYLKHKESNISKAKKKSKHKHQYEECLIQYRWNFKSNVFTQEEKDKLKIYEENISKAPNSRVKAGIAMSMIDYSIMHITSATLETITGDDDQFVDPAHNFALQDLTDIQTQLLASQSTDTDEDSVDSSEQASFAEETTK